MKRLSGTDALFLSMETPTWHQHVGGMTILDPENGPISYEDVLARVEERIHYAPKFTWKLKELPLGVDRPVWIDDPDFDARRHVRRIAVPSPGGAKEIGEIAGTLMSTQLDRRWPLWELWFIEGLAGGKVAMMMKYHHCLLDGVAGASLATVMLDLDPGSTEVMVPLPPESERSAGSEPSDLSLVANSLGSIARRPFNIARYGANLLAKGISAGNSVRTDERNRAMLRTPATRINGAIGPRRELAFSSVAMKDVHALKDHHGAKVNDIVLTLVAGALRNYLNGHGELPESSLTTGVPVSTRPAGDSAMDNQISMMWVGLGTDIADPIERLNAIKESTRSAKAMQKAIGAREIQSLGEVASPLILSTALRAVYRSRRLINGSGIRLVNTLVSNVPGPPIPLYMCGAKVIGIFPCSVIMETMGLNITVFSYMDRIDFGLLVDPDLIPDSWEISKEIRVALADLMAASGLEPPTPVEVPIDAAPPKADSSSAESVSA